MRLSAIGDVCHAVAMVQAIQRQCKNAQITWIVGKVEAQLLQGLAGVELIVFDKRQGWRGYQTLWRQLKGKNFDVLLHMQVALRASIATIGIKAKRRIGFDKTRAKEGQWLFTNEQIEPQNQAHVLEGFMNFAKAIGVTDLQPQWDFPLQQEHRNFAKQHISKPTLIICPSASKAERNWLPERYAQIADYAKSLGLDVMLCGGPAATEATLAEAIIKQTNATVINMVGQTNLKQLMALLGEAKLVLAPDTGPAHMATTQGTPVIGLYAHSNPQRTGPYLSLTSVVSAYQQHVEQQQGKPLAQIPFGTRAKGSDLMQSIEVETVKQHLSAALKLH